jgi:hypothetical protein
LFVRFISRRQADEGWKKRNNVEWRYGRGLLTRGKRTKAKRETMFNGDVEVVCYEEDT